MTRSCSSPALSAAEVAQQGGELVDPDVEVLVGDDPVLLVLGFRHPDKGRLVLVGGYVPVDAVVGGVEFAPREPLPEGRVGGVQGGVPVLVPREQVRVLAEVLGVVLHREPVEHRGVRHVGLGDEVCAGADQLFLSPVRGDLRLAYLALLSVGHTLLLPRRYG